MKDIGEGTIRRIDWQELMPVVVLLRIFNAATGLRVLFLAGVGVLLTLAAGLLFNMIVLQQTETTLSNIYKTPAYIEPIVLLQQDSKGESNVMGIMPDTYCAQRSIFVPWELFGTAGVRPFSFQECDGSERVLAFCWLLMLALIWSFFGGLICRFVALRLTVNESESLGDTRRFMQKCGGGFLAGFILVLLGVLCCLIPVKLAGLAFSVPILNLIVACLFPVVLLFAFFAVVLLFGLLVGWPLLLASVAVDGADGFEAVSRTYSYVYQRPLHYFLYWIFAGMLGLLGFILVSIFVDTIVALSVHVGGFSDAIDSTASPMFSAIPMSGVGSHLPLPALIVTAWCAVLHMVKMAFLFAWFWTSSVTIYLLLRRSVDATPLVEVLRMGAAAEKPDTLPAIISDEKGATVVEGK